MMNTNSKKFKLLKNKRLRNKYLTDQIKIGLRNQFRSLRDDNNLTQKDLAELIGTKQSVISRLENNPETVSLPTLLKIAEKLDVGLVVRFESIDTILDWYNNPSKKKMTPRKSTEILDELEVSKTGSLTSFLFPIIPVNHLWNQNKIFSSSKRKTSSPPVISVKISEDDTIDVIPIEGVKIEMIKDTITSKKNIYEDDFEESNYYEIPKTQEFYKQNN